MSEAPASDTCARDTLPIADALALLDSHLRPLDAVTLPLSAARNRVLAQDVASGCDLPPFDQSSVDGYAVQAADLATAGADTPVRLPVVAISAAEPQSQHRALARGECVRIFTGGLVPVGADCIVRQEWVEREGDHILVHRALAVGADLRLQGEEMRAGTPLLPAGQRLGAGLIGALAAAGVVEVAVTRAPRIRVLVTGDELVALGETAGLGQVFDANGPLIGGWLAQLGYADVQVERVRDTEEAVRDALQRAFAEADLVLSSGGVSVGDRDLMAPTAEALGAQRLFWKVAQKPGKPLYAAVHGRCVYLGLPGNPASVLVNLAVFARRALGLLEGETRAGAHLRPGTLGADVRADRERDFWLRAQRRFDSDGQVRLYPLQRQASHMLSNLAQANCLVLLPARGSGQYAQNEAVQWLPLDGF